MKTPKIYLLAVKDEYFENYTMYKVETDKEAMLTTDNFYFDMVTDVMISSSLIKTIKNITEKIDTVFINSKGTLKVAEKIGRASCRERG